MSRARIKSRRVWRRFFSVTNKIKLRISIFARRSHFETRKSSRIKKADKENFYSDLAQLQLYSLFTNCKRMQCSGADAARDLVPLHYSQVHTPTSEQRTTLFLSSLLKIVQRGDCQPTFIHINPIIPRKMVHSPQIQFA